MKHKKRRGYWKRYDRKYRITDLIALFSLLVEIAKSLGKPFDRNSKKGRPFALEPEEYVSLFVLHTHLDWSLRDLELFSPPLTNNHVDHSTFDKIWDRIPNKYLKKYLSLIDRHIQEFLKSAYYVCLADSSGVQLDRIYEQRIIKGRRTKARDYDKLHVLAKYYSDAGIISIPGCEAGKISDSRGLDQIFSSCDLELEPNTPLYTDTGFDSNTSYDWCYKLKLIPVIPQRDYDVEPKGARKKGKRDFDAMNYDRYRKVIEGIFGGLQSRRLLFSRYRKESRRQKHIIAMGISHNIQTYLQIFYFLQFLMSYQYAS